MAWFDDLHAQVTSQGQRPHVLNNGAGRLLVCEHGARVLACELPGVDHNLFFHTDRTADDGGPGMVTGGDRLWIAPEVAYFWPTLDDALRDPKGTAETPTAIDPGGWRPAAEPDTPAFDVEATAGLRDRVRGIAFDITMRRSVHADTVCSPLPRIDGLRGCGFVVRNTLSFGPGPTPVGATAGAWDILQVPPGGTLICPTTARAEARSYYDPFGDRHVVVGERDVRFLIDGKRRIKMGLRARHVAGRMGYYRPLADGTSSLIFRAFLPQPGEPYADVPRDDELVARHAGGEVVGPFARHGDCLQAYNDDGDAFGGPGSGPEVTFGEMEYHDPCLLEVEGPTSRSGACVTHVMAGPDDAVRAAGEALLGVEVGMIG